MVEQTARFGLPLLVTGQGQKEETHNEAVVALDALVHSAVLSRSEVDPPVSPDAGACWLVPVGAVGAWVGRTDYLACWTDGGWRFLATAEGCALWVVAEQRCIRRTASGWRTMLPLEAATTGIALPTGGAVVDVEARAALNAILLRLTALGLVDGL